VPFSTGGVATYVMTFPRKSFIKFLPNHGAREAPKQQGAKAQRVDRFTFLKSNSVFG
jgi:hypothetical protein